MYCSQLLLYRSQRDLYHLFDINEFVLKGVNVLKALRKINTSIISGYFVIYHRVWYNRSWLYITVEPINIIRSSKLEQRKLTWFGAIRFNKWSVNFLKQGSYHCKQKWIEIGFLIKFYSHFDNHVIHTLSMHYFHRFLILSSFSRMITS